MHNSIKPTGLFTCSGKCNSIWAAGSIRKCWPRIGTNYGIRFNERLNAMKLFNDISFIERIKKETSLFPLNASVSQF